jgi:queuine/archaeosine tRNA-ribosyltransferase
VSISCKIQVRAFTVHNIHFFMELVTAARSHIIDNTFAHWKRQVLPKLLDSGEEPGRET